jgi:outer membrane protein OmpA-like peptidoglycan-associated protein
MRKTVICLAILVATVFCNAQIGQQGSRYAQEGLEYYQRGEYDRAIKEFLAADRSADGKTPAYLYWLGRLYVAKADTSSAMLWFGKYQATGDGEYLPQVDSYLRIIQRQAKIFRKVNVRPLPDYVNSRNSDYGAVTDPEGKYLYFTSLRPASVDKENIWRVEIFRSGFGQPELVSELSTDKNEAFGSFSTDPSGAWIFGNYEKNKRDGDIYFVPRTDKWFSPQNVSQLNTSQVETHPMVYRDRLLFFASSREGGFGGMDLYVSEKIGGVWSTPLNLGPVINTADNEQTPFLDFDGRTLYFSSRGHPGFGGYDIFKAYRKGSGWQDWSIPENLGLPVNSTRDDRHFSHVRGSNGGYLSSDRQVNGFEKIYQVNFELATPASYLQQDEEGRIVSKDIVYTAPARKNPLNEDTVFSKIDESLEIIKLGIPGPDYVPIPLDRENPEEGTGGQPPAGFVQISGTVTDQYGDPVIASVEVAGISEDGRNLEILNSNLLGSFLGTVPPAGKYSVVVNQPGYLASSEDIIREEGGDGIDVDIRLRKLEKKASYPMDDIVFAYESSRFTEEAISYLDLVVMTMLANPGLKARLVGHALETGTKEYNEQLAERRVKAVYDHLIEKGIPKKRIKMKSYGNSQPLPETGDGASQTKSRRVEITLES